MDVIANREPYAEYGKRILEKCAKKEVTGIMAAHSIPNLFYILRKDFSQEEWRALLKDFMFHIPHFRSEYEEDNGSIG